LSDQTLRYSGENVVEVVERLDALDLRTRSTADATYFDIGQTVAVSWGPVLAWLTALAALLCGTVAWFKALGHSVRLLGIWRWILQVVWAILGVALVSGSMIGTTWALRTGRAVYHPWYARPDRLFFLLLCVGALAGWLVARAGAWLPARAKGPRHPLVAWSLALPVWIVLCGTGAAIAPSAGFLWSLPLLIAGIGLLAVPAASVPAVRAISVVVLAVAGTLWLRDTIELMRFMVCVLGRLPIVTPAFVYAALMLACGAIVVPPFVSAAAATQPIVRPSAITAILLVAVATTAGLEYASPAYTYAQPQRRHARVLIEPSATTATLEVGAIEPGLDLDAGAPGGWSRTTDAPSGSVPWPRMPLPFVFRTTAPAPGAAPATVSSFSLTPVAGGTELSMTVVPQTPGLTVLFMLPRGLQPARTNLPGRSVGDRWQATFVAIPTEGLTWRASFRKGREADLADARAVVVSHRYPGGAGWQSLPAWLPQDRAVWTMTVAWALSPAPIAPVPALR
jgi:hypothetical protein